MNGEEPRIVERDGTVVRIIAGAVEVVTEMTRADDEILFDRLSIDGAGPGTVGLSKLKELARRFAKEPGRPQNPRPRNLPDHRGPPRQAAARDHHQRIMEPATYVVALLGWSPGYVVNRLVEVLRGYGYSLADAFRLASQVADGAQVAIPFATLEKADQFAREARALGVRLEIRLPASAAS